MKAVTRHADNAVGCFLRGELDTAAASADFALEYADNADKEHWNYGNAIFDVNTVLGLVALTRGDEKEAVRRLLAASETPGSPQLDTFGPTMLLADKLLQRGHQDTVVQYMENCKAFWRETDRLENWIVLIENGRMPDFMWWRTFN